MSPASSLSRSRHSEPRRPFSETSVTSSRARFVSKNHSSVDGVASSHLENVHLSEVKEFIGLFRCSASTFSEHRSEQEMVLSVDVQEDESTVTSEFEN